MTHSLIIDCDPGIDDALALMLALGNPGDIHLLAVTCVAGNRPVDVTTANARALLDLAGRSEVPVYGGAAGPLDGTPARFNLVHGEDGLGGVDWPQRRLPSAPLPAEHAADYLARMLSGSPPHSIDIAAVGPLTNLALAEARHPGVLSRARHLLVMGGAVRCAGNVTPAAEFNFYADPAAAQQVLNCGARVTLFGLDVTSKAAMSNEWLATVEQLPGRCARLCARMLRSYAAHDPLIHDASPLACLLEPDLFGGSLWNLQVDCSTGPDAGHVRGEPAPDIEVGAVRVMFEVNAARMLERLRAALRALP